MCEGPGGQIMSAMCSLVTNSGEVRKMQLGRDYPLVFDVCVSTLKGI